MTSQFIFYVPKQKDLFIGLTSFFRRCKTLIAQFLYVRKQKEIIECQNHCYEVDEPLIRSFECSRSLVWEPALSCRRMIRLRRVVFVAHDHIIRSNKLLLALKCFFREHLWLEKTRLEAHCIISGLYA